MVSGVYCFNKKPFVIGHLVKTDVFINFSDSPIFANKTEYYKKKEIVFVSRFQFNHYISPYFIYYEANAILKVAAHSIGKMVMLK